MSAQQVTLEVGEEHEIRLPGLSSAGYQWFWEVEGDREAIDVTRRWESPSGRPQPVGTNGDDVVTVVARRPGRAQLRLEQRRRWEEDVPPIESQVVMIEVED